MILSGSADEWLAVRRLVGADLVHTESAHGKAAEANPASELPRGQGPSHCPLGPVHGTLRRLARHGRAPWLRARLSGLPAFQPTGTPYDARTRGAFTLPRYERLSQTGRCLVKTPLVAIREVAREHITLQNDL